MIHRAPLRRTALALAKQNHAHADDAINLLLTFAIVWFATGSLNQQNVTQIILLAWLVWNGNSGAIVIAFEFPGVVANAMTGVVIVLGQRVGRGIVHSGLGGEWRWTFLLPVLYAFGAIAVALTSTSPLTPIFPFIISSVAIIYVLSQVGFR